MQTCSDGQWGATMSCEFACVDDECGGVCDPGSTQCASGTEVQTCGQTGEWGDERACNFVCTGTDCGGVCQPNARRCKNNTQEQTCNAQGQWQDGQTCAFACVNNACGGVCKPGAQACANRSQAQSCNAQGQWETRDCPNESCVGNSCAACQPGSTQCKSTTQYEECTASGAWSGQIKTCEFACTDGQCDGQCKPGMGKCDESGAPSGELCDETGNWERMSCKTNESCAGGQCGSHPRTVFVSSRVYRGNLGGLAGADEQCAGLARAARLEGTFKAFLLDANTDHIDQRFKMEGGPFKLPSGKVVAYNWESLLRNALLAPLNEVETGTGAPIAATLQPEPEQFCDDGSVKSLVWANVRRSGAITGATSNCANWTKNFLSESRGANFGNFADTSEWKDYCLMAGEFCNTLAHIVCIQD